MECGEIMHEGNQLKLSYDGTYNTIFAVGATGDLTITPSGKSIIIGEHGVKIDPVIGTNLYYSGITEEGTAGYGTTAIGDVVYLASADGKWEKADASAEGTTKPEIGIALTAVASDATLLVLKYGYVRVDTFSITNDGAPLFLSTTLGGLTETAPSSGGEQVRRIGSVYDASAHTILFNPDNTWLEI